ncbi:MAG: HDOD domain-containing protein [Myxococcota bacterium]
MATEPLANYLDRASGDLPTIPKIASEVIEAIEDPEATLDDVRVLIEQDAALSARVLKVSNSSLYSFATEIRGLEQALSLLGSRTVKNLIMASAMRAAYAEFGTMEQLLWTHSAAAGPVCSALAKQVGGVDQDEAFTAGLLHDIGKAALANSHREEYESVVTRVREENARFSVAEREQFGFDHTELGAEVARRWELPESLVAVIAHHHDPEPPDAPAAVVRLTALVSVTTACLSRLGSGRHTPIEALDPTQIWGWEALALDPAQLDDILAMCEERIEASQSLCS